MRQSPTSHKHGQLLIEVLLCATKTSNLSEPWQSDLAVARRIKNGFYTLSVIEYRRLSWTSGLLTGSHSYGGLYLQAIANYTVRAEPCKLAGFDCCLLINGTVPIELLDCIVK